MELPKVQSSLLSFSTCTAPTFRQLLKIVLYRCLCGLKMTQKGLSTCVYIYLLGRLEPIRAKHVRCLVSNIKTMYKGRKKLKFEYYDFTEASRYLVVKTAKLECLYRKI